ncbi:histidine phosphatase family protein [Sulfurimonas sp.]
MKITLVRHAQVSEEYKGKYNGHIDIPLSQNGKKQAKELAKKLQHINFDKIYCSDLLRARETLEAFDYDKKPIYTDKLREKSWGKHEGKSFDEIQNEGIQYIDFEQWINALDGEEILSYKTKIKEYFFATIFEQIDCEHILVVSHAGVIKTLISIINNMSLEESFKISLPYATYLTFYREKMTFLEDFD